MDGITLGAMLHVVIKQCVKRMSREKFAVSCVCNAHVWSPGCGEDVGESYRNVRSAHGGVWWAC